MPYFVSKSHSGAHMFTCGKNIALLIFAHSRFGLYALFLLLKYALRNPCIYVPSAV